MATKVTQKHIVYDNGITSKWIELEFVKWTPEFLIVKYPAGSLSAGKDWKMGRKLVNYWLQQDMLKIEGDIPEWALIV
jgi:hypothetical protein